MTNIHARPGFDQRMTKEEINACPMRRWEGKVQVVRTPEDMPEAVAQLGREHTLGFDTETRPAYKKGESYLPSLLQLATHSKVFIFQLKHLGLPKELHNLLADPTIVKAGVALDFDVRELKKLSCFKPGGFVDLGNLAKEKGIKNHGLRGLAAVLLGFRISKGARTSNWANDTLTKSQINYAATDAWVGRELYEKLLRIK